MKVRSAAIFLAVVLLAGACDDGGVDNIFPVRTPIGRPSSTDSLVIGLVGTLSGPESWKGEDAFEGADLAVHELNQARPEDSMPFELISLDDEGDPAKARSRIEEIVGIERSVGIIYAGPEGVLPDLEDRLASRGIPAITIFGDLYARRMITPHVFQAAPSKVWEARRLAAYLSGDRRYRRIGILAPRSPEGMAAVDALDAALPRRTALVKVRFQPGDNNLRPSLDRLRARHVEAVVMASSASGFSHALDDLKEMDALYLDTDSARIASASRKVQAARIASDWWHPQLAGFDQVITPRLAGDVPAGTVASDSYARGVHYLPVPDFRSFRRAFGEWWDGTPTGWEQRSYDAARLIGWTVAHSAPGDDLAEQLETFGEHRFGGLDITLGPDDHTLVDQTRVGLWVVPGDAEPVAENDRLPEDLPWVPLARGFSINGRVTDVAPQDWRFLFRKAPPTNAPPPSNRRWRFGVHTPRSDPLH